MIIKKKERVIDLSTLTSIQAYRNIVRTRDIKFRSKPPNFRKKKKERSKSKDDGMSIILNFMSDLVINFLFLHLSVGGGGRF